MVLCVGAQGHAAPSNFYSVFDTAHARCLHAEGNGHADYLKGHSQGLIAAFYAYESGQTDVKHSVAYRDVPLLVPVTILHEETHSMTDLAWEHMNIWQWPQKMRCKQAETRHIWLQDKGNFYRAFFAFFTDFEHEGIIGDWHKVVEMLWGYPEMLDYEPPHIHNRLAEVELAFGTLEELETDWAHFRKEPSPIFGSFCDDIFGDG